MLLIDTNVLSKFRKINAGKGDTRAKSWAQSVDANLLFVSVITLFELQVGTELVERRDAAQRAILRKALDQTLDAFSGRPLSIDLPVARG